LDGSADRAGSEGFGVGSRGGSRRRPAEADSRGAGPIEQSEQPTSRRRDGLGPSQHHDDSQHQSRHQQPNLAPQHSPLSPRGRRTARTGGAGDIGPTPPRFADGKSEGSVGSYTGPIDPQIDKAPAEVHHWLCTVVTGKDRDADTRARVVLTVFGVRFPLGE
jgi:hypothetical protein